MPCGRDQNQRHSLSPKCILSISFYCWKQHTGLVFNVSSECHTRHRFILHGERFCYFISTTGQGVSIGDTPSSNDILRLEWADECSAYIINSTVPLWEPVLSPKNGILSEESICTSKLLTEGLVLLLGSTEHYVKGIAGTEREKETAMNVLNTIFPRPSQTTNHDRAALDDESLCKICFLGTEEDNPLFRPCACKATFTHLTCLQTWISNKNTRGSGRVMMWTPFRCEVCFEVYPPYVNMKTATVSHDYVEGETVPLMDPPDMNVPLLILYSRRANVAYLLSFSDNDTITMGRNEDCDIHIDCPSVSRNHAEIRWIDRAFYVEDCHSRFGTYTINKRNANHLKTSRDVSYYRFGPKIMGIRIVARNFCNFYGSLSSTRLRNDIVKLENVKKSVPLTMENNQWYQGMSMSVSDSDWSGNGSGDSADQAGEQHDVIKQKSIEMDDPFR